LAGFAELAGWDSEGTAFSALAPKMLLIGVVHRDNLGSGDDEPILKLVNYVRWCR
jgi:hypothetical protein